MTQRKNEMASQSSKPTGPTRVDAIVHADKRANIPTADAQEFVGPNVELPIRLTWERDPSLDPQLVWKGKDKDADELQTDAPPIFIQEKIDPRVLIENLRKTASGGAAEPELTLFDGFDGLNEFDLVDFYRHQANWSNRMILGDSLQVMGSLAEREGLRGKVQMIYLDPPYGIKFASNWQMSTRKRDVKDGKMEDATFEVEQIKAFRDTWELGIHSYLTYLRDRLMVARDLLTDSGSIFVQIGDTNLHLVRSLLDEVLGAENFCSIITYRTTSGATNDLVAGVTDFVLWYGRQRESIKYRQVFRSKAVGMDGASAYSMLAIPNEADRRMTSVERADPSSLPTGARPFRLDNLTSQSAGREKGEGAASWFMVRHGEREFRPTIQSRWKTNEAGMARLQLASRLGVAGNTLSYVRSWMTFPRSQSITRGTTPQSLALATRRCTSCRPTSR